MRSSVRSSFREYCLPLVLLALSAVTTTANGARFMQNFLDGLPPVARDSDFWPWRWLWDHPGLLVLGWTFSASLLGILLIHEFGHYLACRCHRIRCTLPWVLPAPTLSGTAGAIIRIRSRIPSRRALMDVGIYGPLAGYLASLVAVAAGFLLSRNTSTETATALVRFGPEPLTIRLIHRVLLQCDPALPPFERIAPHPVLIAGWIGLFITSLNLLPGGQLDGGHVLYAVSPRLHRACTRLLPFALFLAGIVCWAGWILWGIVLMTPAMRHPDVPAEPKLDRGRVVAACAGLAVFALTFTATPFYDSSLLRLFAFDPPAVAVRQASQQQACNSHRPARSAVDPRRHCEFPAKSGTTAWPDAGI